MEYNTIFFSKPLPALSKVVKNKSIDKVYLRVILLNDYLDAVAKYNSLNVKDNSLLTYLANKSHFWGLFGVKNGKIFSLDGDSYSDKNLVAAISEFKEDDKRINIMAVIYVERSSQKGIIIGSQGEALKKVGTQARLDIEAFFGKKVFLNLYVKVLKDWRNKDSELKNFGYANK